MPWFRQPTVILTRLLGLSTTVWFCRKVGCWARSLSRLGALVLRFVRRGRPVRRIPEYGHLLLVELYPGNPPCLQAASHARDLTQEAVAKQDPQEALNLLGEAVLLSPPDPAVYLARAQAYQRWQRHVEALDDAELCVSLDGTCTEGWLVKGMAEHALGRSADAALSYQAGLQLEPAHVELQSKFTAVRAEPPPNLVRQFKDLFFAARLGLENLFRTLEDPEKTTDAFVESNAELLDAQVGLLAQTLHVNTVVLFESPRLCDAYEQIVHACSQLVAGAPGAFSKRLTNAPSVVEGLSLALRLGWLVHHSIPKLAANALITLATCPTADDQLRRTAVRQLLGGLLRWLLDARPEPDKDTEEVCGCGCSVPWKAAACFLERLFEPGKPQPWVREECEAWPDSVQLCQWLTLSVRDYHATPLGLVSLLQMPGVAAAAMKSQATVDFFIAPPPFGEDDLLEEGEEEDFTEDEVDEEVLTARLFRPPADEDREDGPAEAFSLSEIWNQARASQLPWWRAAQVTRQPPQKLRRQLRAAAELGALDPAFFTVGGSSSSSSPAEPPEESSSLLSMPAPGPAISGAFRWFPDPNPPPPQRLGEWMMASLGYLFLFIEGDALFTVCACRALQAMAQSDPDSNGRARLLRGVWLGVPMLSKLSLVACSHTAALDLLHCLFEAECPVARAGIRSAVRSLAHALSETAALQDQPVVLEEPQRKTSEEALPPGPDPNALQALHDETDIVPSWAEFHHELLQELACAPRGSEGEAEKPELVTLYNFESKASLLAEHVVLKVFASPSATCSDFLAVPAAWNRGVSESADDKEVELAEANAMVPDDWQAASVRRLQLFYDPDGKGAPVGSENYIADTRKKGKAVLMSRRSIRLSSHVHNWPQAVAAAEQAGAKAVVVFNDLDGMEPFRMGLFGEKPPSIPAFMVNGKDGATIGQDALEECDALIIRCVPASPSSSSSSPVRKAAPWPLSGGRLPADVAQAWSLLEALSKHGEPGVEEELEKLLKRMSVPEKRVWLTRRLVRHHRAQQAALSPEGDLADPPLAFVEGDRWLSPSGQLAALRRQLCEGTGMGSEDICGEFEVRFRGEQGVGSAVVREWMDLVAREAFVNSKLRLLRSFDRRQTFWPDAAAPFCNARWRMDYELLGRLVGLALWQSCTLDLPLHPHVCGLLFDFSDDLSASLAEVDEELHRCKVRWLLANPVADLGVELPFSDPLGSEEQLLREAGATEPLKPEEDGTERLPQSVRPSRDRLLGNERGWDDRPLLLVASAEVLLGEADDDVVTEENKARFVEALVDWRLHSGIGPQVEAMKRGLGKVMPPELRRDMRSLLSPVEIAQLISGAGTVSVEDWEQHTSYTHGLSRESDVIQWFWKTVRGWADSEEQSCLLPQLLQFVTGSARVPVGGFSELVGFNGAKHAFTLANGSHLSAKALPMAHACICTLDLPPYQDLETCRSKMTQMLQMGRAHFDEAAGRAEDG